MSFQPIRRRRADWIRDFDQGKKQAQAEGKDLFLLFTGHGWCAICEVLDREVFQKDEFVQAASADYVLVELEFNFGDSPEEKEREKEYRGLQRRYLVRGFPTIVLADPNACQTQTRGDFGGAEQV